jgi:type IX secretion system PorP/SprF family membrane protein
MKKTLITLTFCLVLLASFAQQDAQFSMNMFNRLAINPAYAGMNKQLCVTMLGRQQWVGFPGAPKTGLVSIDYGRIWGGGIGLTVDQDVAGFQKFSDVKLAYSYHKNFNGRIVGFGINAGMFQSSLNGTFVAPDGQTTDPNIPWSGTTVTTYDIGLGIYYQTRRVYAGLSSSHLPEQQIAASGTTTGGVGVTKWDYKYQAARHYYIMAGYTYTRIRDWEITPSIFAKSVIASTQIDINLLAKWRRTLFGGAGYRLNDAVIVMAGVEKRFSRQLNAKLGVAYDVPASGLKTYNGGSWELMLGFCYKITPEAGQQSHMNVRFL